MKTKKPSKKLTLNKKTVARLSQKELKDFKGGTTVTVGCSFITCMGTCLACTHEATCSCIPTEGVSCCICPT
jgi:natural product precursor